MPQKISAWQQFAGLGLILGFFVLSMVWLRPWQPNPLQPKPPAQVVASEVQINIPNPGYLGPKACIDCHADRVAEFQKTRHFLAMCTPSADIMPAGFLAGRGSFEVPELSLRFDMTQSQDKFLQTVTRQSTGNPRTTSEIAFVYGAAGGNDEVYFTWHGDKLYELPMVWLAPTKEWGTDPFDPHSSGDFSRDTTIRCIECHTTWFEHVPGSRNQYGRQGAILGVTCEVCHGPGQDHVAYHREHPQEKQPHDVVRPALLARERLMDLCAQCHSNALKHRGPAFSYRPGKPLDDFYYTIPTHYPEDDHVANQTTYLRQSRCFQQSETMTCVTCHNPHKPRSATNAGAESCKTCHKFEDCTDRNNLPAAVQDDCIACHMPEHRKIQVHFRTQTDRYVAPVKRYEHRIGIHPLARHAVLLKWYRQQDDDESRSKAATLAKDLAKSWDRETTQRQDQFRYLAAIDACREALSIEETPERHQTLQELIKIQTDINDDYKEGLWHQDQRRYSEAIDSFERLLKRKPDHAARAKLGTLYAVIGEKQLAFEHLEKAAETDFEPYPQAMMGWLTYLDGRYEESLRHYQEADKVEPYSEQINYQMGLVLAKLEKLPDAIERFTKATTIDPKSSNAFLSLSQSQRAVGKPEDAVKSGLKAVQLTQSKDLLSLINLADAYAESNRLDDAITTTERALTEAQSQQPKLVPQIRTRLAELRAKKNP